MLQLLLIAAAAAPLLHIDLRRDASLPCAAHAALEGRLEVLDPTQLTPRAKPGALEVQLDFRAGSWELQLLRRDRSAALTRELHLGGTDCALLAESAALVLDRYLAALRAPEEQARLEQARVRRSQAPEHRAASASSSGKAGATRLGESATREREAAPGKAASAAPPAEPTGAAPSGAAPSGGAAPGGANAAEAAAAFELPPPPLDVSAPPAPLPEIVGTPTISPAPAAAAPTAVAFPAPAPAVAPVAPAATAPLAAPVALASAAPIPSSPAPAPAGLAAAPPIPAAPPGGDPMTPAAPLAPEEAPRSEARGGLGVALGPAAIVGLPGDLRVAGWLELEHPIDSFSVRLFALGAAQSSTTASIDGVASGRISTQSLLTGLAGGPCLTGWLHACASLFAGVRATVGDTTGDLVYERQRAFVLQPEFGALLSLDRELSERFALRLSVVAGAAPGTATFQVAGGTGRTLSTFDVAATLLLGYRIF